jgi:hypothetical protein
MKLITFPSILVISFRALFQPHFNIWLIKYSSNKFLQIISAFDDIMACSIIKRIQKCNKNDVCPSELPSYEKATINVDLLVQLPGEVGNSIMNFFQLSSLHLEISLTMRGINYYKKDRYIEKVYL